jgi:branched-chain amino acid transport system substrate-binding protein
MRNKSYILMAVLVVLSLMLSSCSTPAPSGSTGANPTALSSTGSSKAGEKTIKIGVAISQTGQVAREGKFEKDGIDYWKDLVNSQGGIEVGNEKYKVDIVYYDDQSSPETSMKLTEKLITEDKVQFLIGPYSSGIQTAAAAIGEKYKMITITPLANATTIYDKGYKYIYSVLPPATKYLQLLIDMTVTMDPKPTTIAIMARDDPFGLSVAAGVKARAEEKGLKVIYNEKFAKNVTDMSPLLSAIKNLNPDILIATTLYQDAVLITKQAKDMKVCPKMMAFSVGVSIPDFPKELGADANYIFGAEWWLPNMGWKGEIIPSADQFAKEFEKKYGYSPSYHSAAGAAAGLILQLAIKDAGSLDTEKVREALVKFNHDVFWGPTAWDQTGANIKGGSGVIQILDGKVVSIYPEAIMQQKPVYPMPCWDKR